MAPLVIRLPTVYQVVLYRFALVVDAGVLLGNYLGDVLE